MDRILVVDDSGMIGKLIHEYLSAHGYEVNLAYTAEEGFRAVKKQIPDLILMDIQLPDVGGFDFCRVLRSKPETKNVPIHYDHGYGDPDGGQNKGLQLGADDYLTKPFEMAELQERIRAVLRRKGRTDNGSGGAPSRSARKPLIQEDLTPEPVMSMGEAISSILFAPYDFPHEAQYPGVALGFLVSWLGFLTAAIIQAPGLKLKPLLAVLIAVIFWVFLVSVLVVVSSFMSIALRWKEGARLMSLAMLPVLMKTISAFCLSAMTSLSPFLFTASPAFFVKEPPGWLWRVDLFEVWSLLLLFILVKGRARSSAFKALIVTGVMAVTAWLMILGLGKIGLS